jgi:hypothetical protein
LIHQFSRIVLIRFEIRLHSIGAVAEDLVEADDEDDDDEDENEDEDDEDFEGSYTSSIQMARKSNSSRSNSFI